MLFQHPRALENDSLYPRTSNSGSGVFDQLHHSSDSAWREGRYRLFFLSKVEFEKRMKAGDMLETADVYGEYYGTPKAPVLKHLAEGRDVLLDIDVQGARQIRASQDVKIKAALADIFIMP